MTSVATDTRSPEEPDAGWNTGFKALLQRRLLPLTSIELKDVVCYGFFGGILYAGCYLAIGKTFLPGGSVWALIVLWLAAHLGGFLISLIGLHPLLGQLLAGMVMININAHWLLGGLKRSWSAQIRVGALALIFLRSGLELDWEVFKKVGWTATRLLLIPGIIEAFVTGSVAHKLFDMPLLLGFTLGFILKAVGPAIVIQLMFDLQRRGRGVDKGIPALVVAAASFDDLVAITFYTIFASVSIQGGTNGDVAWQIAEGPVQLIFGVIGGLLAGLLAAWTKVWDTRWKRAGIVFCLSLAMMYFLNHWGLNGGGALAALVLGMTVSRLWALGKPALLAKRPDPHYAHNAEHLVGIFWRLVAQPLLFGLAGSGINFHTTRGSIIPKSVAIIVIGIAVRLPSTFFVMSGAGLTLKERIFVMCAWWPKATVQAALASGPLTLITAAGKPAPWPLYGQEIFVTAIFCILICASCGVIAVSVLAPRFLNKTTVRWDPQLEHQKSKQAPGYAAVGETGDELPRPGDGGNSPPTPPAQPPPPSQPTGKRRSVSGLFSLPVSSLRPSGGSGAGRPQPSGTQPKASLSGAGATARPASAEGQPAQQGYEAEVLREQDTAVSEHLAQLEALAASIQDPTAARRLRTHADELRRRKVEEYHADGSIADTESARTFFRAHSQLHPEEGLPVTSKPGASAAGNKPARDEIQIAESGQSAQSPHLDV